MRNQKLPLVDIVKRVLSVASHNVWPISRVALPVILLGILELLLKKYYSGSFSILTPFFVLQLVAYAMAIVGIHRIFLLPAEVAAKTPILRWSMREARWLWWIVVMMVLLALFSRVNYLISDSLGSPLGAVMSWAATLISIFCAGCLVARCSLVFPSVSVDGA